MSETDGVVSDGQGWKALGRAVRRARESRPDYVDTTSWALAVGRSSRQVLGLERGERVGAKTLRAVEAALGWPEGRATDILNGYNVWVTPRGDVQEFRATVSQVFREGTLIGEVYLDDDATAIVDEGAWKDFSDARLAQLVEEVAVELQKRANARVLEEMNGGPSIAYDLAADKQRAKSEGEHLAAEAAARGEEPQVEP